jgi:hypothetical protein
MKFAALSIHEFHRINFDRPDEIRFAVTAQIALDKFRSLGSAGPLITLRPVSFSAVML